MNQLGHYHKRRKHFIDLLGGRCVGCGSKENLELDHVNPKNKSFTISSKMSYAYKKVLAEVKKCQLLCGKCHKLKNKKDNGEAKHGSISMYRHHRCRCESCVKIWRLNCVKWKLSSKNKKILGSSNGSDTWL